MTDTRTATTATAPTDGSDGWRTFEIARLFDRPIEVILEPKPDLATQPEVAADVDTCAKGTAAR